MKLSNNDAFVELVSCWCRSALGAAVAASFFWCLRKGRYLSDASKSRCDDDCELFKKLGVTYHVPFLAAHCRVVAGKPFSVGVTNLRPQRPEAEILCVKKG